MASTKIFPATGFLIRDDLILRLSPQWTVSGLPTLMDSTSIMKFFLESKENHLKGSVEEVNCFLGGIDHWE